MAYYDEEMRLQYARGLYTQGLKTVLPIMVGKYGLDRSMNFWSYVRETQTDRRVSGRISPMHQSTEWSSYAKRALDVLGGRPYAAGPTLETRTPEEARMAEKKRISRRRGRGRGGTMITGELEPQTKGKALLG